MSHGLNELSPIPIDLDLPSSPSPSPTSSRIQSSLSIISKLLFHSQRASSLVFTGFGTIHGITVLIGPLISIDTTNELITIGRSLYQSSLTNEVLMIWFPLGIHVISGICLRLINKYRTSLRYGRIKKHAKVKKHDSIVQKHDHKKVIDDTNGLTGGLSNLIGLGPRLSGSGGIIRRWLGLTPLQLSGYLLIPFLTIHTYQVRFKPLLSNEDVQDVSIEFVSFLLKKSPVLNSIVLIGLVSTSVYHSIYGLLRWLKVRNFNIRRFALILINSLSVLGIYNIYSLFKLDISNSSSFILKKFEMFL